MGWDGGPRYSPGWALDLTTKDGPCHQPRYVTAVPMSSTVPCHELGHTTNQAMSAATHRDHACHITP